MGAETAGAVGTVRKCGWWAESSMGPSLAGGAPLPRVVIDLQ
jgi:hypothetical protein